VTLEERRKIRFLRGLVDLDLAQWLRKDEAPATWRVSVRWNVRFPKPIAVLGLMALFVSPSLSAQIMYPPPPTSGYQYAQPESDLQLVIKPREAAVYVDGYYAGIVDDFDGMFQRLHVSPGEHEITVYLQGYRTITQHLYLAPNGKRKITETMEKLLMGELNDPPPLPAQPPQVNNPPPPLRDPLPNRPGRVPPSERGSRPPEPPSAGRESSARGGSLVLQVQPSDADVIIDGEHWRGPDSDDRLVVQVSEGRHRIEVRKDGYTTFTTEIEVRRNDSVPVNVSLARGR